MSVLGVDEQSEGFAGRPRRLLAPAVHIVVLLQIMGQVEQCHGCLGESVNCDHDYEAMDAAADAAHMPAADRWWRSGG